MKLLLPCWLVFLAAFSGLPAAARAADRVLPLIISQPQTAAGPVSGLPTPATAGRTQQQGRNPPTGSSSRPNLRFDRLSATDGLSYSLTTSILQDRQGFMWFGTRYGLNQFDGFDFKVFVLGSSGDVLFANYIRALYQDRNGDLWISNLVDLVRRDIETGKFVHYKPDAANPQSLGPGQIYPIAEDGAGVLWVGTTEGLNRYDTSTDTFTRILPDVSVLSFLVDRQGGTWLGTGGQGLWHYPRGSPGQEEPEIYRHDPSDPNSLSDDLVWSLFEDQQGALWVGTYSSGLYRLDPATGKFTHFQHDPEDPQSLSDNSVRSILEDSTGRLWIGTDNGLNLLDRTTSQPQQGRFFQYHYDPGDPHSLSSDAVWDIYEDRSGVLWIATLGGISKLNETASHFTHYQQGPNPLKGTVPSQPDLAGVFRQ
jgi:ligand-binding sensor domain-containing protein